MASPSLEVRLPHRGGTLVLRNPVMPASGTFGYGTEYADIVDVSRLGAVVTKGITLVPWSGNSQPRIWETASGMLNSIGLENIGVDAAIRDRAPLWACWDTPVIVNVAGRTMEEYREVSARLDGVGGVAALEINISCPNVSAGSIEFGTCPETAAELARVVRSATSLPVIMKLSPNVTDVVPVAEAVVAAGADAVCLINTLRGTAIDIERRRFRLGRPSGGLSGPAIKPVALHMVREVARAVSVPVIGCGGIAGAGDALEFIMAGATAVQMGTATFTDARAMLQAVEGMAAWMARHDVASLSEIRGIV
jgi:dihydroorotate dehydrogenase (NAD+) catalytic subunit